MKKLVGNDILDLFYAGLHSNWKRPGFLAKVFTEDEQKYINTSEYPETTVWLLWSMKESAYKVFYQQYCLHFFNPLKIRCRIHTQAKYNYRGEVNIADNYYKTISKYSERIISTVAVLKEKTDTDTIISEVVYLSSPEYKIQHREVYDYVIKRLTKFTNENLSIKKDVYGIPRLYKNDIVWNFPISLSHHGRYGAFAVVE